MKKLNLKPGEPVWILERNEDGEIEEISRCLFLAQSAGTVIGTPRIDNLSFEDIMAYHIEMTIEEYTTELLVYPENDCFETANQIGEAAMEEGFDWSVEK